MNVSLSGPLEKAVKKKITSGKYRSVEELVVKAVSRLIEEEDAPLRELSWLEKELQDGLDTATLEMTDADWENLRQRIEHRVNGS